MEQEKKVLETIEHKKSPLRDDPPEPQPSSQGNEMDSAAEEESESEQQRKEALTERD